MIHLTFVLAPFRLLRGLAGIDWLVPVSLTWGCTGWYTSVPFRWPDLSRGCSCPWEAFAVGVKPWVEQNSAAAAASMQQWTRVGEEVEVASIDEYRLALVLGKKNREEEEEHDGNGGEEDGPMAPILMAEEVYRLGDFLGACVANHQWLAWLQLARPEISLDVLLLLVRCIVDHWELEDVLFVICWNYHEDLHCLSSFHHSPCACADDLPGLRRPKEKSSFRRRKPQAMCCSRSDGYR
mmetsp:Transcript_14498/g.29993  ORF Transcript_14498/g.29993 Transcript_14498/m.29993 type:complete len:238 (+) Transcript_14498:163-876(+)